MGVSPGDSGNHWAADEQAALRRVAILVARAAAADEVLAAITEEVGRLLGVGHAVLSRYDPGGVVTTVAAWSSASTDVPVGNRVSLGGSNVHTLVFQTGRQARVDDCTGASGAMADFGREPGLHGAVGAPVSVEGQLWGVLVVGSVHEQPLPADTEARLAGFTEMAATAIANAQARVALGSFAEEQAALRRVATLVASGATPEEVLAAVTEETGRLLGTDHAVTARYNPDCSRTLVSTWSSTDTPLREGTRAPLGGRNVHTLVFETGRAARIDDYADASGVPAEDGRAVGLRVAVAVPISIEGRLWGAMGVASTQGPLPADAEERLAGFTELAAIAIADAQARSQLRGFAEEQAALRRVATLVASGAPPEEVFTAVTCEAGQLLRADYMILSRYDPEGLVTIIGAWAGTDPGRPLPIGVRLQAEGQNIQTLVLQTRLPARVDDCGAATGAFADTFRDLGFRASVGVPIWVEGRLWGFMIAGSQSVPLPAGTEARLAEFTELAATALANGEAQAALTASRARIVAAADQTRRRVERDLHDGAQQRLVSMALRLRAAQATLPPEAEEVAERLEGAVAEAVGLQEELRKISQGLYPAVLAESGLRSALRALARRSAVPVRVDVQLAGRLAEPVEIAAYYAVSEALTNVARHARASAAEVEVATEGGVLRVRVRDDGRGGADYSRGSGLTGVRDRVEAFGGRISLHSPRGAGTTVEIALPLGGAPGAAGLSPASAET